MAQSILPIPHHHHHPPLFRDHPVSGMLKEASSRLRHLVKAVGRNLKGPAVSMFAMEEKFSQKNISIANNIYCSAGLD